MNEPRFPGPASFAGIRTFMRLPFVQGSQAGSALTQYDYAVVGLPFDTSATWRPGARFGPAAIREASLELRPYNPVLDIVPAEWVSGVDLGDLDVAWGREDLTFDRMTEALARVFSAGCVPISLGGDHSVSLPVLRAAARHHGPLALVHFDAHSDTCQAVAELEDHGTPFRRAVEEGLLDPDRSFQFGLRGSMDDATGWDKARAMGFTLVPAHQLDPRGWRETVSAMMDRIGSRPAYLSFDVDFVDPAFAPGTGTPEPGGFSSREALQMVRALTEFRWVGFDLVEVLPMMDPAQVTAVLAANLVFEFITLLAVDRRSRRESRGG